MSYRSVRLLILLCLIVSSAEAAGFDCTKTSTQIERLICDHPDLSKLDDELADFYRKALARSENPDATRKQQRSWLRATRNRCPDVACLKSEYTKRIDQLAAEQKWLTNAKVRSICDAVVQAVNDGSIGSLIQSFHTPSPEEERLWNANAAGSSLYLHQTQTVRSKGVERTLGFIQGGGTCGNCDIVDLVAKQTELYPPDDEQERLRWAGWGKCDHLLFIEDEPIIVTGRFGWGESRMSLVLWLAPDGAKRALCYSTPTRKINVKTVRSDDAELCRAASEEGAVEMAPWPVPVAVPRGPRALGTETRVTVSDMKFDEAWGTRMDIDMDGKEDTIGVFDFASGAGCGSYHQWLMELTPDGSSVAKTPLNDVLRSREWGPIKGPHWKTDDWFSVEIFQYRGKPYIRGRGMDTSAAVMSIWGGQLQAWCEYQLLPQHHVEVYYRVEEWPDPD